MGRGDPDPRPPIEVVGAEPDRVSFQRVSSSPRAPKRPRGKALLAAGAVMGLLLVGLALGGGDDGSPASVDAPEERDNRERAALKTTTTTQPRSTTTRPPTTTTTIPVGPVFGQAVGGSLLAFGGDGWRVVDLDTGARREVDILSEDPYDAMAVTGGVVLLSSGPREAWYYDVLGGADAPEHVVLGSADQILPAGRPDRLWLVDAGGRFEAEATLPVAQVRLVDLRGEVLRSFEVPSHYVAAGVEDGLVLGRGGRAYLADEEGIHPLAVGQVLGAAGNAVVLLGCDDLAVCTVELRPLGGGDPTELLPVEGPEDFGFEIYSSRDGKVALQRYGNEAIAGELSFFAADGRRLGSLEGATGSFVGLPRWLPGDLGLVAPLGDRAEWVHQRDGEWVTEPLPALDGLPVELALVIQP